MLYRTDEQAISNAFFGKLLFHRKEEFYKNALQSDGIKRGSPNLRLENQPVTAGMDRISDNGEDRKGWMADRQRYKSKAIKGG